MSPSARGEGVPVEAIDAWAYTVPTEAPESDGTLTWDATTLVVVEVRAGDRVGLGYTYAEAASAALVRDRLRSEVTGRDAMNVAGARLAMFAAVRNAGRPGMATMAIAAVDVAMWDLKAKLLEVPLVALLGAVRDRVPVYGSGGFTSQSGVELREHCGRWVEQGIGRVKIKIGRRPARDVQRVRDAREGLGPEPDLFVDANGAYDRKQALGHAHRFAGHGVSWFEEPVSSDDLRGLRLLRDHAPPGMEITAGEYGHDVVYFRRMLEAGAVDVLMVDASRCGGITGLLQAGALCEAFGVPLSTHAAPALHLHPACAIPAVRHVEYFFDHVRIEQMLFDGAREPEGGALRPDLSRPGLGLELKRADAEPYLRN